MTRPPEPEFLRQWRGKQEPIPRCCHTCDHYDQEGRCDSYDMMPPAEFASQRDSCNRWLELIPF